MNTLFLYQRYLKHIPGYWHEDDLRFQFIFYRNSTATGIMYTGVKIEK